jgi:hypothetical protein
MPSLEQVHNLSDPYQDIGYSKSEYGALKIGIGYQGAQLGQVIQNIVILPEAEPGKAEEGHPKTHGEERIKNFPDPEWNP